MKEHTNIRMDKSLKKALMREAKNDQRTFTNYVERLLNNHPDRKLAKGTLSVQDVEVKK